LFDTEFQSRTIRIQKEIILVPASQEQEHKFTVIFSCSLNFSYDLYLYPDYVLFWLSCVINTNEQNSQFLLLFLCQCLQNALSLGLYNTKCCQRQTKIVHLQWVRYICTRFDQF